MARPGAGQGLAPSKSGTCARVKASEGVITGTKGALTVMEIRRRLRQRWDAAGRRPWGGLLGVGCGACSLRRCPLNKVEAACDDPGKGVPG